MAHDVRLLLAVQPEVGVVLLHLGSLAIRVQGELAHALAVWRIGHEPVRGSAPAGEPRRGVAVMPPRGRCRACRDFRAGERATRNDGEGHRRNRGGQDAVPPASRRGGLVIASGVEQRGRVGGDIHGCIRGHACARDDEYLASRRGVKVRLPRTTTKVVQP